MKRTTTVIIIFVLYAAVSCGQTVNASIDKVKVRVGDRLTYRYTVIGEGELERPAFWPFQVISEGGSESSVFINNRSKYNIRKNISLVATVTGTYTITGPSLTIENTTYSAADCTITVLPAANGNVGRFPPPDDDEDDSAVVDIFNDPWNTSPWNGFEEQEKPDEHETVDIKEVEVVVDTDKKTAYLYEPVTITYYVYYPAGDLRFGGIYPPHYEGAVQLAIQESASAPEEVIYKGKPYLRIKAYELTLAPIRTGSFTVEPTIMYVATPQRQVWFSTYQQWEFQAPSVELMILPLPSYGAPDDFDGAVGSFGMDIAVEPATPVQYEYMSVVLTVTGEGNFKSIPRPASPAISNCEDFSTTYVGDSRYYPNRRVFEYCYVPQQEGTISIPSFSFSYFDPAVHQYRHLTTAPRTVDVLPVGSQVVERNTNQAGHRSIRIGFIDRLPSAGNLRFKETKAFVTTPWFFISVFLPILLFTIVALLEAVKAHEARNRGQTRFNKAARTALTRYRKIIKKLEKGNDAVDRDLEAMMTGYIADKLNTSVSGLIIEKVTELMHENNFSDAHINRFLSLYDRIHHIRYAGSMIDSASYKELAEQFRELIVEMEQRNEK